MIMIVGWRQWADAGSVSSGLPAYLAELTGAHQIGSIRPDGYYLFQIPGTHDLVRPEVRFRDGYPETLETRHNEIYFFRQEQRGVVILIGDEPHLDIDRYTQVVLDIAGSLGVRRIIGLGGVYGELPYTKERMITATYSLKRLREEISRYAVNFSDYAGGASIGSYLCKKAGERGLEYVSFYAFVPAYNITNGRDAGQSIRLENDYQAWLGILKRLKAMFSLNLDLSDLEEKNQRLIALVEKNIDEIDQAAPELGIRDYLANITENFNEQEFNPLDDVWENELKRLLEKLDQDENDES
jgi:proteasome assembly chaperone (PAC2) family protein